MQYKYKFSVVMAIYNVEKWLEESISSIINQTLNFERDVQIILVNDGSTDNCEEICLKYEKLYPNNILYKFKTNGGQSSARNLGIKFAEGEIINFLDPDDTFPKDTFKEVYSFMKKHWESIDFVTLPLYFFEAKKGLHGKYKDFGNKNRIVDLREEPHNFVLSSAASFYKKSKIEKLMFDESFSHAEDADFNLKLYLKNPKFGFVCENEVKYNYRQRNDNSSIVSSGSKKPQTIRTTIKFIQKIEDLQFDYLFLREMEIYFIKNDIKNIEKKNFSDINEYNSILNIFKNFILSIGIDRVISDLFWCESLEEKLMILNFVSPNIKLELDEKLNVLYTTPEKSLALGNMSKAKIDVRKVNLKNNILFIELIYHDFEIENIELIIKDNFNNRFKPYKKIKTNSPYDLKRGEVFLSKTTILFYEVDISKAENLDFYFQMNSNDQHIKRVNFSESCVFHLKNQNLFLFNNKYSVIFKKGVLIIKRGPRSQIKYNIVSFIKIWKKYKKRTFFRLLNSKRKKYILIMDRPNVAGDNGEAIFKYISKLSNKEKKNYFFVISKESPDYLRLKKYGKVIAKNSFIHKFLYVNSKMIITSHIHPLFYKPFSKAHNKYYLDILNYKLFWLQHGIIKADLSSQTNKYIHNIDRFVVSTRGELDEISQEKYLYFNKEIILTGLPRFDFLINNPKNIITIIPTWRKELSGPILPNGQHSKLKNFELTNYYKNFSSLLKSEKLKSLLIKSDIKIIFVLHPAMDEYYDHFEIFNNDDIKIIKSCETVYSKIFAESKLLITDYSSVFFDFAYLKKPEIFFQFDKDIFFDSHYKKGNFDHERDAFGDVLTTVDEVVDKVEYYINNNFKMEDKYIDRVDNTFAYTDRNNCKRVYEEILKLDKE